MNRFRRLFAPRDPYEPVDAHDVDTGDADDRSSVRSGKGRGVLPFSRYEYSVFLLLGVSMLWAWYVVSCLEA